MTFDWFVNRGLRSFYKMWHLKHLSTAYFHLSLYFLHSITSLFNSSKSKVFVGTFVIPFPLTLMCQICGNLCLPLGLKLVHWLFTEKIAGYDLPSWWQRVGIVSLNPQWIPGEKIIIKSDKRGFSACLPACRHLYAYKQASHALKLK